MPMGIQGPRRNTIRGYNDADKTGVFVLNINLGVPIMYNIKRGMCNIVSGGETLRTGRRDILPTVLPTPRSFRNIFDGTFGVYN